MDWQQIRLFDPTVATLGSVAGEALVTFVNTDGRANRAISKTLHQLSRMWTVGERNPHALTPEQARRVEHLATEGLSQRAIARETGAGRRAISRHLQGKNQMRDGAWRVRKMKIRVLNLEDL